MRARSLACLGCLVLALAACVDDSPRVSIDFSVAPEVFTGARVMIDGKVVGALTKTGHVARLSFPVSKGTHTVSVIVPGYTCQPATVEVPGPGLTPHLILNFLDSPNADGRPVIGFHP